MKTPSLRIYQQVLLLWLLGVGSVAAQNLVTNGGFESGITTGWSHNASGGATASFSTESNQPYAGTMALKVVITNVVTDVWRVQTLGPSFANLGTNRVTTISFRARAATNGTRVRFVMQNGTYVWKDFTNTTAWTYFSWSHTTVENSPRLRIQYPSVGTVWLDEISVVTHDASGIAITPDPTLRFQTMDGVGGALTWYADRILSLTATKKAEVEKLIFDDLGLDIIRLKNNYFPANYPTNKAASGGNNKTFYDMAKKNGRDIKILLSSWSPPANLKDTGQRSGLPVVVNGVTSYVGTLAKDPNGNFRYADFAQYWVDLLDNCNTNQWFPDYISVQNEPGFVSDNETCDFAPTQTSTLPGYTNALYAINQRIKNRPDLPILVGPESETINQYLNFAVPLRSSTYLGINAYHTYDVPSGSGTPPNNQAAIDSQISKFNQVRTENALHGGRGNWMTEYSKGSFDWLDTAHLIHNMFVEANASAYIFFKLVWGNSTNALEHMISIDGGNYVVKNTYYGVKHFSKEISRGDQRFQVTKTGSYADVRVSGYIDPTGKKLTFIALNTGSLATNIALRLNGLPVASAAAFQTKQADTNAAGFLTNAYQNLGPINHLQSQTLPAQSITTYVINLTETLNPYDPALLRVDSVQHLGNQMSLAMPAQPGQDFILWKSTTLAPGSWQVVTNAVRIEQDGQLILTDPNPDSNRAFYRIQRDTGL